MKRREPSPLFRICAEYLVEQGHYSTIAPTWRTMADAMSYYSGLEVFGETPKERCAEFAKRLGLWKKRR